MRQRTVLILGSSGQLGGELRRVFGARSQWNVRALSHEDIELTDAPAVHTLLRNVQPWAVVNCAAYNGVEAAETNPAAAFAINTSGVASLAHECRALDCLLVHFSTDYVFDGYTDRPYVEADPPAPLNIYGLSKLAGEQAVRLLHPRHCLVRTCGLYGRTRSPNAKLNFVEAILLTAGRGKPLEVRSDLVCTPTSASELAEVVAQLVEREMVGTFNVTNTGWCSWYQFAQEILLQEAISRQVVPVPTAVEGARRPRWSVLSAAKLEASGVRLLSPWQEALADYLRHRKHGF